MIIIATQILAHMIMGTSTIYVNFSNSGYYHIDQFYGPIVILALEPVFSDYNPYLNLYMREGYNEYSTINQLIPISSSNETIGHGDWVLEAFFQKLDNPNSVEVIAIDIDFTDFNDFNHLFYDNNSVFEACYSDAINNVYDNNNQYLLTVFNASFGGQSPPPNAVDDFINDANALVVQASANVNQNGIFGVRA